MQSRTAGTPPAEARRLLLSVSPFAGARSSRLKTEQIAAELRSAGYEVTVTEVLSQLHDLASRWHEAGDLRAVLACGGDGTASVVRNHTPLDIPLVLVPLGTENLLARYLSQSPSAAAVRETVDQGLVIQLDLGWAADGSVNATATGRYFLMMVSAGFDADVVRRLQARRRGHITRGSYVQPTLESIRSYQYPEMQVYCETDGSRQAEPVRCRWMFGFNLPLYACGLRITPDAVGTDGLVDVCAFRRGSLMQSLRYLWHVGWGSHCHLADVEFLRSRTLQIDAAGVQDVAYQLDGDFGGVLPVDVKLLPGKLRLLVMPEVARRLDFEVAERTKSV